MKGFKPSQELCDRLNDNNRDMFIKLLKRLLSPNMYMQLAFEAQGSKISLSLQLRPYFVCVRREGSGSDKLI